MSQIGCSASGFDTVFRVAQEPEISVSQILDYFCDRLASNLPLSAFANILDRLSWCMEDNGSDISKVREAWLRGADARKVEIALSMEDAFPFRTREDMEKEFRDIGDRFPQFVERLQERLMHWDQQHP